MKITSKVFLTKNKFIKPNEAAKIDLNSIEAPVEEEALETTKKYNVALVAGSRPKGIKQFGSKAEELFYIESKTAIKNLFKGRKILDREKLGVLTIELSQEEVITLEKRSEVLYIEEDIPVKPTYLQTTAGWGLENICNRTDDKFIYDNTGKNVTIYIIDNGMNIAAPEFGSRASRGYDSFGGEQVGSHGTLVAAIAGGKTYGVAKQAFLVDVKVGNGVDTAEMTDIIGGLNWVLADHSTGDPAVANMSFGAYTTTTTQTDAVAALIAEGVICVASAGNDGLASVMYPALEPNVLAIGAIQEDLDIASFSNYGIDVDLLAPGVFVDSINKTGTYEQFSGTSCAAPFVAGAAAAMITGIYNYTVTDITAAILDRCQVDLSTNVALNTTKDCLYSYIPRLWFASSGSVGNLKAIKNYTLKPYSDNGTIKSYESDETVTIIDNFATTKKLGLSLVNYFGVSTDFSKLVGGDNPSLGTIGVTVPAASGPAAGPTGDMVGSTLLNLPFAEDVISVSLDFSGEGGTMSMTTASKPSVEVKESFYLFGMDCQVERVGPSFSSGSKSYAIDFRLISETTNEFVSLYYPDLGNGDSYMLSEILADLTNQANILVTLKLEDRRTQSFEQTGRYLELLSSLAGEFGGELIQQNGVWFITDGFTAVGDFTANEVLATSIAQADKGDMRSKILDWIMEAIELYIELDSLADDLEDLEEQLEDLEDDTDDTDDTDDAGYTYKQALGEIHLEFGLLDNQTNQLIPNNCEVISNDWDIYTPEADSDKNPDEPTKNYFQVIDELDSDGAKTGNLKGLNSLSGTTVIRYYITPPSNASGIYFCRGTGRNFSFFSEPERRALVWESINVKNYSVYDEGTHSYIRKYYIELHPYWPSVITYEKGESAFDAVELMYKLDLEMAYVPVISVKYKFSGEISYDMWPVTSNGKWVGMVNPDGDFYDLDGNSITTVSDIADLPGTVSNNNCVIGDNGGLAAVVNNTSFETPSGSHCGVISSTIPTHILLGNNSSGPLVGIMDTAYTPIAWPGFAGDLPADSNLRILFKEELPTDYNIDWSGYDPAFPGDWVPTVIDPNDETSVSQQEIDLLNSKAELIINIEIATSKLNTVKRNIASYGINLNTEIDAVVAAKLALKEEQDRQTEFSVKNYEILSELHEEVRTTLAALIHAIGLLDIIETESTISFLYENSIPMPGNSFFVDNSTLDYDAECGLVQTTRVNFSSTGCIVTVTTIKRGI